MGSSLLRRKIIKRFRQKALLENNISSKGFLIYIWIIPDENLC